MIRLPDRSRGLNISVPNPGTGRTTSEISGSVGGVRHGDRATARRVTPEWRRLEPPPL